MDTYKLAKILEIMGKNKDMGRPPVDDTERKAAHALRALQDKVEQLEKENAELKKDAARLKFICEYLPSDRVDLDDDFVACVNAEEVVFVIDSAMESGK